MVVNEVYAQYNYDCVLTEGTGGKHRSGSLHYVGLAMDFRMNDVDQISRDKITSHIRERLSNEYDVVLEQYQANPDNDHLHVEYQPK